MNTPWKPKSERDAGQLCLIPSGKLLEYADLLDQLLEFLEAQPLIKSLSEHDEQDLEVIELMSELVIAEATLRGNIERIAMLSRRRRLVNAMIERGYAATVVGAKYLIQQKTAEARAIAASEGLADVLDARLTEADLNPWE